MGQTYPLPGKIPLPENDVAEAMIKCGIRFETNAPFVEYTLPFNWKIKDQSEYQHLPDWIICDDQGKHRFRITNEWNGHEKDQLYQVEADLQIPRSKMVYQDVAILPNTGARYHWARNEFGVIDVDALIQYEATLEQKEALRTSKELSQVVTSQPEFQFIIRGVPFTRDQVWRASRTYRAQRGALWAEMDTFHMR